jgi:hypothetical protein
MLRIYQCHAIEAYEILELTSIPSLLFPRG